MLDAQKQTNSRPDFDRSPWALIALAVARSLGAGSRIHYAALKGDADLFGRALAELRPSDLERVREALRALETDEMASAETRELIAGLSR